MREAGDVCYSDVFRDGTGIVEFVNKEDMHFAVKHLHDTKFKSHEASILLVPTGLHVFPVSLYWYRNIDVFTFIQGVTRQYFTSLFDRLSS